MTTKDRFLEQAERLAREVNPGLEDCYISGEYCARDAEAKAISKALQKAYDDGFKDGAFATKTGDSR